MPASTTRKAAWLILQAWGGIEEYIHPLERTFAREIPTSSKFRELPHNASELADGRPRNWEEAVTEWTRAKAAWLREDPQLPNPDGQAPFVD